METEQDTDYGDEESEEFDWTAFWQEVEADRDEIDFHYAPWEG